MMMQDNAHLMAQAQAQARHRRGSSMSTASMHSPINPGTKYQAWAEDMKEDLTVKKRIAKRKLKNFKQQWVTPPMVACAAAALILLVLIVRMASREPALPVPSADPNAAFNEQQAALAIACQEAKGLRSNAVSTQCATICAKAKGTAPR
jgi:hypothetical protein